ncbi:NAD-dependent epimerase/dehydratase family protein [Microbacterium sp. Bi121]|uniref:NAD-dependent epimerase/dehydratase family protein n=1 Tax=Microbacterium sp. Bi121 TaxID=2822348 RepID=UPI001E179236|nr:NAD-dependent epimerase/dehydratase family protein [Microbacterium sp. Bi121]CAH0220611.1 UDP-N-acetylglucosamine 4-epimerase [Microbacterium sp. Bi121]
MKVLVTGGAGFIGANFIAHCRKITPDWEMVAFDDLSTGSRDNLAGLGVKLIIASVADVTAIEKAAEGADAIVHLGALGSVPRSVKDPVASHVANLTGTLNVLEAARKNRAYVTFASSSSVYGANTSLPKSEFDWTRPMSPYAVTKLGAEAYVLAYQRSYELPTLAFRFFNVYGPLQAAGHVYAAVIPRFLDASLNGRSLVVHGDGQQSRDFTYVETVTAALHSAVSRRLVDPDPVNLAFGTRTTLIELIEQIRSVVGAEVTVEHVEGRLGDVRASQADGIRMRALFPDVQPKTLDEGLRETVAWFRSA